METAVERTTDQTQPENDVVIYLDEYRKAKAINVAERRRGDEELLCVNWNPAVAALAKSCFQTEQELSPELPEDFSAFNVEEFLDRVYALASQV